jgi:hypothetical protein
MAEAEERQVDDTDDVTSDDIFERLARSFGILRTTDEAPAERLLEEVTLKGVADYIKSKCKNIIVMTGAGISTAAGIPDFRSPGTGLYDNLQKYNLPSPQSVFDITYFKVYIHKKKNIEMRLSRNNDSKISKKRTDKLLNIICLISILRHSYHHRFLHNQSHMAAHL